MYRCALLKPASVAAVGWEGFWTINHRRYSAHDCQPQRHVRGPIQSPKPKPHMENLTKQISAHETLREAVGGVLVGFKCAPKHTVTHKHKEEVVKNVSIATTDGKKLLPTGRIVRFGSSSSVWECFGFVGLSCCNKSWNVNQNTHTLKEPTCKSWC